jgi:hypothetical protein
LAPRFGKSVLKIAEYTKRTPEEAINKAVEFFGPNGYGLKVTQRGPACAYFAGGGGDVLVTACTQKRRTYVDIEAREWEYQAREFLRSLS